MNWKLTISSQCESSCECTVRQLSFLKMSFPWVSMWTASELSVSSNSSLVFYWLKCQGDIFFKFTHLCKLGSMRSWIQAQMMGISPFSWALTKEVFQGCGIPVKITFFQNHLFQNHLFVPKSPFFGYQNHLFFTEITFFLPKSPFLF